MDMTQGARLIVLERERQILREGYSAFHDMQHDRGELVKAAICYLRWGGITKSIFTGPPKSWPWDSLYWKPGGVGYEARLRCLVKAGALIAAAIDRLIDARERAKRREEESITPMNQRELLKELRRLEKKWWSTKRDGRKQIMDEMVALTARLERHPADWGRSCRCATCRSYAK